MFDGCGSNDIKKIYETQTTVFWPYFQTPRIRSIRLKIRLIAGFSETISRWLEMWSDTAKKCAQS